MVKKYPHSNVKLPPIQQQRLLYVLLDDEGVVFDFVAIAVLLWRLLFCRLLLKAIIHWAFLSTFPRREVLSSLQVYLSTFLYLCSVFLHN